MLLSIVLEDDCKKMSNTLITNAYVYYADNKCQCKYCGEYGRYKGKKNYLEHHKTCVINIANKYC